MQNNKKQETEKLHEVMMAARAAMDLLSIVQRGDYPGDRSPESLALEDAIHGAIRHMGIADVRTMDIADYPPRPSAW